MNKKILPPTIPPDSDLVKLTKEFESLKERLANNDDGLKECDNAVEASRIEHTMVVERQQRLRHARLMDRRVIEAQLQNVTELLRERTQTNGPCRLVDMDCGQSARSIR